jgi:hypothetical protein
MKTLLLVLLLSFPILSQTTEDTYRQIDRPSTLAERKAIYNRQTPEAKLALWKHQFRLALRKYKLDAKQRDILSRLSKVTTKEQVKAIEPEIAEAFPFELGHRIFFVLGNHDSLMDEDQTEIPEQVNCVCTTSSYNYSCPDPCSGGQSCATVSANCGIMWLWDCNGMCSCH